VAFVANLVVAAAKLAAGLLSGSSAMLAEAGHSLADSLNEVLLGVSLLRAEAPADLTHPLGHGRERFLWAFMAAIASFLIGGCVSIGLAVREAVGGEPPGDILVPGLVLAVAFVADGTSLVQSLRQARREADERGRSLAHYVLHASDPALRAIVVEDGAALVGVMFAAIGLLMSYLLGSHVPDALASFLIGVLLALTAFGLARPLADFLVGRSLPAERLQQLHALLIASPAVDEVLTFQAVYTGPEEVIVAAKVHPTASLTVEQLTHAMDELDSALRSAVPEVADVYLDVTSYRLDSLPLASARAGHESGAAE
jgi:cation diffusion facilitator family transporter